MKKLLLFLICGLFLLSACDAPATDITNESTSATDSLSAIDFPDTTTHPSNVEITVPTSTEETTDTINNSVAPSTNVNIPNIVSSITFDCYSVYLDSYMYFNYNDCIYCYDYSTGQTNIIWEQNDISCLGNIGNTLFFLSGYQNEAGVPLSDKLCSYNLDTQEHATVLELEADWYSISTYSEYLWIYSGSTSPVTYTVDANSTLTEAEPPFTVNDNRHTFETPNYYALTTEEDTQLSITAPEAEPCFFEGEERYYFILDASEDCLLFYEEYLIEDTKSYAVYAYNSINNEVITLFDDLPSVIELHDQWVIAYLTETVVVYDLKTNTCINLF